MDLQRTDSLSFYLVLFGAVVEIMKKDEKTKKYVKLIDIRHVHSFSAHAGAMHRKTVHTAVRTVFRDMSRWRHEIRDIGASWQFR